MKYTGFYYSLFKGSMKKVIAKNYGIDYANKIMKKSKELYKKIVKEAPDMGRGNPMAYNALFAYAFFSPYLASGKKIKKEIVADMMREGLFHIKWFFSRTNLNTPKGKLQNSKSVRAYYKWYTEDKEKKYPNSFKVDFEGIPYEGACYYRITKCPICDYAKALDCMELMPLFCELDKVMINMQHGELHREFTLARGESYCDYFITGDKEVYPPVIEEEPTEEEALEATEADIADNSEEVADGDEVEPKNTEESTEKEPEESLEENIEEATEEAVEENNEEEALKETEAVNEETSDEALENEAERKDEALEEVK